MAKDKDWNDKSQENKAAAKKEFEAAEQDLDIDNISFLFPGVQQNINKLEELNTKHIFINSSGGKSVVTHMVWSEVTEREEQEFISLETFKSIYSNDIMPSHRNEKTNTTLGVWWLEHPKRRTLKGVIFDPIRPKEWNEYLNLWNGFAEVPKKGSWKHTRKHIWKILSNSNAEKFKYFIKWLAWTVQNPHERAEVAVIFVGKKGAGKGFIFTQFVQIFGQHGMAISDKSRLTGKFTAHFRSLSFLFADEIYHPGEKEVEGRIKAIITEPYLDTEAKMFNAVQSKNRLHIAMATNNEWVISAGDDERRYYINKVEDVYTRAKSDQLTIKKYFTRLWGEMNNGGRAAMLFDLLKYDLKGWHPRNDIPQTTELKKQKRMSFTPLHHALRTMLEEGIFPGDMANNEFKINATSLYEHLEKLEPITKNFSMNRKADLIKELGAEKRRWGNGVYWFFPSIKQCRQNWDEKYGRNDWDSLTEWQVIKAPY
jgi:hypothetical protein